MKKKILLRAGAALAVLVVALLAFAATKPNSFHFRRSVRIAAPAEAVFARINDFRLWGDWSPYEKLDPAMKRTYSGSEKGPGAVYEWSGNGNVGKGRIEITEATSPSRVALDLRMIEPMEGHNDVEFTLEPEGDGTLVTWSMQGSCPYATKLISVFISMDSMIGGQFEEGLANLKAVSEKAPNPPETATGSRPKDGSRRL